MIDYFRGWRRKLGVVALLFALLFAVGWVRSFSFVDSLTIRSQKSLDRLLSTRSRLKWERLVRIRAPEFPPSVRTQWESHQINDPFGITKFDTVLAIYSLHTMKSRSQFYEFESFQGHYGEATFVHHSYWVIPYWGIVLPLTAFSGLLLLITPRRSNGPRGTHPGFDLNRFPPEVS